MTEVTNDQFHWQGVTLVHEPTGAKFSPGSRVECWGAAGTVTPSGQGFDKGDIFVVANQVLATAKAASKKSDRA